ncbi:MAG TPA: hypothetical protein VH083_21115, partial [Myxococcales bacterium]|nr:hypothetical protein [Myxococcales bacterium]
MRFFVLSSMLGVLAVSGCAASLPHIPRPQATAEVEATERAFAKTLADRDHAAFMRFLGEDAVFFDGAGVKRGKAEIA